MDLHQYVEYLCFVSYERCTCDMIGLSECDRDYVWEIYGASRGTSYYGLFPAVPIVYFVALLMFPYFCLIGNRIQITETMQGFKL